MHGKTFHCGNNLRKKRNSSQTHSLWRDIIVPRMTSQDCGDKACQVVSIWYCCVKSIYTQHNLSHDKQNFISFLYSIWNSVSLQKFHWETSNWTLLKLALTLPILLQINADAERVLSRMNFVKRNACNCLNIETEVWASNMDLNSAAFVVKIINWIRKCLYIVWNCRNWSGNLRKYYEFKIKIII